MATVTHEVRIDREAVSPAVRYTLLAAIAVVYVGVFIALDGLRFPVRRDEVHFWPTALDFSRTAFPSVETLRSYGELNTPLPFIIWGLLERAFGLGIFVPRLLNYLLSLAIVLYLASVGLRGGSGRRAGAAVAGVLIFPYFLATGTHAYTDMLPAALVLAGVVAHTRGRYLLAALAFTLAISGRQYMVAFPVALLAWEIARGGRGWGRLAGPALAALSLGGWYLFFGGFGPGGEVAAQRIVTASAESVIPRNTLYFLACIGLYFVVPWVALTGARIDLRSLVSPMGTAVAIALLLAFVSFPPLENRNFPIPTMGYFDRALRPFLADLPRMAVFYLFALLALWRLRGVTLVYALLLVNAVLMAKAHIAWDKYALPLVVVLWYLVLAGPSSGVASEREPSSPHLPPAGPAAPV